MNNISKDEKSRELARIIKTIVVQIDENGNGLETSVDNPEISLIISTILNFCKKNLAYEKAYRDLHSAYYSLKKEHEELKKKCDKKTDDIKTNGENSNAYKNLCDAHFKLKAQYDALNERLNKILEEKKSDNKNEVKSSKGIINSNQSKTNLMNQDNSLKSETANLQSSNSSNRRHRFLSQDASNNARTKSGALNYKAQIETKTNERNISKNAMDKEIKLENTKEKVFDIKDSTNEKKIKETNKEESNKKTYDEIVKNDSNEFNTFENTLNGEDAPLRKIKKSNFIKKFSDLNK